MSFLIFHPFQCEHLSVRCQFSDVESQLNSRNYIQSYRWSVDEIYRLDYCLPMLFNLDPERNEKSLCLPAESCVRVFGNFRHSSAGLASAPHRSVIQSNADRHAQKIALRSISVCRHESLLSALTASHVLRFFIVFTFVMYDHRSNTVRLLPA